MQTLTNSSNYGATLAEAEQHLRNLEPFHTGTLSGTIEDGDALLYVVRSYGLEIASTPLFICNPGINPSAYRVSVTTTKHINIVKKAWDL